MMDLGLRAGLVLIVLPVVLAGMPPTVCAADGVMEINQACATGPGCFPGDAPGFPVELPTAGSYLLTSNLTVSQASTNGITVLVGGVQIDLNGFQIKDPKPVPEAEVSSHVRATRATGLEAVVAFRCTFATARSAGSAGRGHCSVGAPSSRI